MLRRLSVEAARHTVDVKGLERYQKAVSCGPVVELLDTPVSKTGPVIGVPVGVRSGPLKGDWPNW